MAESGVTTWVAGYAAVVATLALLWNVYVAWRDRADVRVSFRLGSLYLVENAGRATAREVLLNFVVPSSIRGLERVTVGNTVGFYPDADGAHIRGANRADYLHPTVHIDSALHLDFPFASGRYELLTEEFCLDNPPPPRPARPPSGCRC
jgi:hypothetical protein